MRCWAPGAITPIAVPPAPAPPGPGDAQVLGHRGRSPVRRASGSPCGALRTSVQRRWLRPAAFERHVRLLADDVTAQPLGYGSATRSIPRQRSFATISHNQAAAAAEYGVRATDPLLDHRFVAALARAGGRTGYPGRTATMHALFSDVLPRRSWAGPRRRRSTTPTPARPPASSPGPGTGAASTRSWSTSSGSGTVWLSDQPTMATGVLLHSAWLASTGLAPMTRDE